jgi:quercetin 2,3-dioxygenase
LRLKAVQECSLKGNSMKTIDTILRNDHGHWVGDGFPVRSLFSYHDDPTAISPFLLFDYAGPWTFEPETGHRRDVGEHPHKGFETVSIVFEGEVSHRDSTGVGGSIGPGEVQWMTAGSGVLHEEFHSLGYSKTGGPFRMVQLWVNLPAKDKLTPARYPARCANKARSLEKGGGPCRLCAQPIAIGLAAIHSAIAIISMDFKPSTKG